MMPELINNQETGSKASQQGRTDDELLADTKQRKGNYGRILIGRDFPTVFGLKAHEAVPRHHQQQPGLSRFPLK